jgi:hypothetical protein
MCVRIPLVEAAANLVQSCSGHVELFRSGAAPESASREAVLDPRRRCLHGLETRCETTCALATLWC